MVRSILFEEIASGGHEGRLQEFQRKRMFFCFLIVWKAEEAMTKVDGQTRPCSSSEFFSEIARVCSEEHFLIEPLVSKSSF